MSGNKLDITVSELYNLEKDSFSDLDSWSWVIFYGDKGNWRVLDILTPDEIRKIDNAKRGDININEFLLQSARKHGVIR